MDCELADIAQPCPLASDFFLVLGPIPRICGEWGSLHRRIDGAENGSASAGDEPPFLLGVEGCGSGAAVDGVFSSQDFFPSFAGWRREQRFGGNGKGKIAFEIGDDEPIVAIAGEVAKDECAGAEDRAVDIAPLLYALEDGFTSAEPQEIFV